MTRKNAFINQGISMSVMPQTPKGVKAVVVQLRLKSHRIVGDGAKLYSDSGKRKIDCNAIKSNTARAVSRVKC
jgi:hypothetical protein